MTAQGTHFWFMTVQTPNSFGVYVNSYQGAWTPKPGETRLDAFNAIRALVNEKDPKSEGGLVLAFDIQPNELGPETAPAATAMEYRLVARDQGRTVAETPWIEIPDPEWTEQNTHRYEGRETVHTSDHTPANFARQHGVQATDIEWRVKP